MTTPPAIAVAIGIVSVIAALTSAPPLQAQTFGEPGGPSVSLTFGKTVARRSGVAMSGVLDVEYRFGDVLFHSLEPAIAAGVILDGGFYVAASLRRDFRIGPVVVTPYTGPALYQQKLSGRHEGDELLQFRSGVDLSYQASPDLTIFAGVSHISNAGLTRLSADIDVVRVGLQYKF